MFSHITLSHKSSHFNKYQSTYYCLFDVYCTPTQPTAETSAVLH